MSFGSRPFIADLGDHLRQVLAAKEIDADNRCSGQRRPIRPIAPGSRVYGPNLFFRACGAVFDGCNCKPPETTGGIVSALRSADINTKKTINVYDNDVFSSFLQVNVLSKGAWKSVRGVREETVDVARLDEVLDNCPTASPATASCSRWTPRDLTEMFFVAPPDALGISMHCKLNSR